MCGIINLEVMWKCMSSCNYIHELIIVWLHEFIYCHNYDQLAFSTMINLHVIIFITIAYGACLELPIRGELPFIIIIIEKIMLKKTSLHGP